jgi:AraC-like DNA-binding protein
MGVSVVMIRAVIGDLKGLGVDPGPILAEAGLPMQALADVRAEVPGGVLERLVCRAYAVTHDPALGLRIGARAPESALQMVGPLMLACGTLREAITQFQRYASLFGSGARWQLVEQGELARFVFAMGFRTPEAARFAAEYVAALTIRVGTHFHESSAARATEVHFAHPAPSYAALYTEVFRCPVHFDAGENALVFPRARLDLVQPHADSTLRDMLREGAERLLLARDDRNTVEHVRTLLRYQSDLSSVDSARIASGLGLSKRVLRRRLAEAGTSVTELLDEARARMAYQALAHGSCNIKELAEQLGFSQPSAFHRAFKRWSGVTPAHYAKHPGRTPHEGTHHAA